MHAKNILMCVLSGALFLTLGSGFGRAFVEQSAIAAPDSVGDKRAAVEQEIAKLTESWAAASRRGDTAAMDRICSDDMTFTHASGKVDSKSVFLGKLKGGTFRLEHFDLEDLKVRAFAGAALATSHVHLMAITNGSVPNSDFMAETSFLWVKGKEWKLAAVQLTRLPDAPAAPNGK